LDLTSASTERSVLSCLFRSRDAWITVSDILSEEDFSFPLHRQLYHAVCIGHEKRLTLDPVVLSDKLGEHAQKELENVGGWAYLKDLFDHPISPSNVGELVRELRELTLRRKTAAAGVEIQKLASNERDIDQMLGKAQVAVDQISAQADEGVVRIGSDLAWNVQQKIEHATLVPGLPTGFRALDLYLQGFQSGELYVLGARKKTGKSVTLLTMARNLALKNQTPILYISTEHHHKLDQLRLLSMEAEVSFNLLNSGMVKDQPAMMDRVTEAVGRIEDAPFHFKYLPSFGLDKIKRMARKYIRLEGVKVVFFDLIKMPQGQNQAKEWQELGVLAYGLKELAGEEGIPVISAVQVNREGANAQRLQEDLDSDYFAGSDRIGQAMTVGFTLRRPYTNELQDLGFTEEGVRILQVTDNRLGPAGYKGILQFEASTLNLRELQRLA